MFLLLLLISVAIVFKRWKTNNWGKQRTVKTSRRASQPLTGTRVVSTRAFSTCKSVVLMIDVVRPDDCPPPPPPAQKQLTVEQFPQHHYATSFQRRPKLTRGRWWMSLKPHNNNEYRVCVAGDDWRRRISRRLLHEMCWATWNDITHDPALKRRFPPSSFKHHSGFNNDRLYVVMINDFTWVL